MHLIRCTRQSVNNARLLIMWYTPYTEASPRVASAWQRLRFDRDAVHKLTDAVIKSCRKPEQGSGFNSAFAASTTPAQPPSPADLPRRHDPHLP